MIIAIDIGGTKTLVASFGGDGVPGQIQHLETLKNFDSFFDRLTQVVGRLNPQPSDIIVAASAGMVDRQRGIVLHSPNLGWTDIALQRLLAAQYGCPVFVANDAAIGALGATMALGSTPDTVLYVTLGTGIGGGLVIHGTLDHGLEHIEIGQMVFAGADGLDVWEHAASGSAIAQAYGKQASEITDPAAWDAIGDRLAVGFRVLIPALQPGLILVGGGLGAAFDHFGPLLQQKLRGQIPPFIPIPPIQKAPDPENAVLNGCYQYALQHRPAR